MSCSRSVNSYSRGFTTSKFKWPSKDTFLEEKIKRIKIGQGFKFWKKILYGDRNLISLDLLKDNQGPSSRVQFCKLQKFYCNFMNIKNIIRKLNYF